MTRVRVDVFGPREGRVGASQTALGGSRVSYNDKANVNVEVSVAAFSGNERKKRGRGDRCVSVPFCSQTRPSWI